MFDGKYCLVTGGMGFVGSNLVKRLIKENAIVTVLDDMSTGMFENLGEDALKVTILEGSVTDKIVVNKCVRENEYIFHLAARNIIASTKNPMDDYDVNIGGTLNILKAAENTPLKGTLKNIVYTSSASVYGNPHYLPINEDDGVSLLTPYAVSKFAGESYCMAFNESYDIPVTVLRLSNVYGINQTPKNIYCGVVAKFMQCVMEEKPIRIYGDGNDTRDFTYVEDVVDAILLAASDPKAQGEVFNVATGRETNINTLAQEVMWLSRDYGTLPEPQYIDRRDIDNIRRRVLNIEKIRRKLHWTPHTDLRKGLLKTWRWMYREQS